MVPKIVQLSLFHRRVRVQRARWAVRDAATLVVSVVSLDAPAVARISIVLFMTARLWAVVTAVDADLVLAATFYTRKRFNFETYS